MHLANCVEKLIWSFKKIQSCVPVVPAALHLCVCVCVSYCVALTDCAVCIL